MAAEERIAYINGQFVPESQAAIPIRDRGFIYGDAAFDVARTFQGRPFRLREHLDRLYASCRYLRLDPGMSQDEMEELTLEVLRQNLPLLGGERGLLGDAAGYAWRGDAGRRRADGADRVQAVTTWLHGRGTTGRGCRW